MASKLNELKFGTLLLDLLTIEEYKLDNLISRWRFDISLQSFRLIKAIDLISDNPQTCKLKIGLFGASTGGAVALLAASERPKLIAAIVSRGGLLDDVPENKLKRIISPTLFIVGQFDHQIMNANEKALSALVPKTQKELIKIPGAGHLFEESGAAEAVVSSTLQWFTRYLKAKK